jgi:hypothetical protein
MAKNVVLAMIMPRLAQAWKWYVDQIAQLLRAFWLVNHLPSPKTRLCRPINKGWAICNTLCQ